MPGTICVACKLPHGLKLQLQAPTDIKENTIFGPRESKQWFRIPGKVVTIQGFAHQANKAPNAPLKHGFALTHGVDADFFEEWMKQNRDSDVVQNGFIFASAKEPDAVAHARDYKDERCGFEPINPDNLPNEFKRKIATASSAV